MDRSSHCPPTAVTTNHLFWENVADCRWGSYLSTIEEELILHAHESAAMPGTALEVGSEGGRWAKMLSDLGWKMICTEIDADALAVCQDRIPDCRCICVDPTSQELPCHTNSVRMLLCIEVHEVLECDWFVREAARVLQPGGFLVGVFQNSTSWRGLVKKFMPLRPDGIIDYRVPYASWRKRLISSGFDVTREEGLCWFPFSRHSDSVLIPAAVKLEKKLGLRRLARFSPWIVLVAKKL